MTKLKRKYLVIALPFLWFYVISAASSGSRIRLPEQQMWGCPVEHGFLGFMVTRTLADIPTDCATFVKPTFKKNKNEMWISHFEKECSKQFYKGVLYPWPPPSRSKMGTHLVILQHAAKNLTISRRIITGFWIHEIQYISTRNESNGYGKEKEENITFKLRFGQKHALRGVFTINCAYVRRYRKWQVAEGNNYRCLPSNYITDIISARDLKHLCLVTLVAQRNNITSFKDDFTQCDAYYNDVSALCLHPLIPCENETEYPCKKCKGSLKGAFCQIDSMNPCGQFPCGNNGSCVNKGKMAMCRCLPGYSGPDCQTTLFRFKEIAEAIMKHKQVVSTDKKKVKKYVQERSKALAILCCILLLMVLAASMYAINQQRNPKLQTAY
ncbi:hypothetical protein M513_08150 [Trichuris suis]|uniref:EGF-like domain-containing protein n=1 Tax=Trichuris suis TaxID=68888 RepID=A0A085M172_9BILA|nr:hypothetical protein M513_08150 [Trichuris suis]